MTVGEEVDMANKKQCCRCDGRNGLALSLPGLVRNLVDLFGLRSAVLRGQGCPSPCSVPPRMRL